MKTAKSWLLGRENILQSLITLTVTELNTELNADYSPPRTRLTFSYSRYKAHASLMTNITLIRLNLSLLLLDVQIKLIFSLCLLQSLWVQTSLFYSSKKLFQLKLTFLKILDSNLSWKPALISWIIGWVSVL